MSSPLPASASSRTLPFPIYCHWQIGHRSCTDSQCRVVYKVILTSAPELGKSRLGSTGSITAVGWRDRGDTGGRGNFQRKFPGEIFRGKFQRCHWQREGHQPKLLHSLLSLAPAWENLVVIIFLVLSPPDWLLRPLLIFTAVSTRSRI